MADGAAKIADQYPVQCRFNAGPVTLQMHRYGDKPVPSMLTSWSLRLASTFWMPLSLYNEPDTSCMQLSQVIGTANKVCEYQFSKLPQTHVTSALSGRFRC